MGKPRTLWHYTDVHGALGIVREAALRFGDARFLNDRTERQYGSDFAAKALRDECEVVEEMHPGAPELVAVVRRTAAYIEPAVHISHLYVCSFSETSDSISQWQRYAADGYGYCLGFDAAKLKHGSIGLLKMIYLPSRQRSLVQNSLHNIILSYLGGAFGNGLSDRPKRRIDQLATYFALKLEPVVLQLKNPQFADEREWRLTIKRQESSRLIHEVVFGPRGNYAKPFLTSTLGNEKLPLRHVVCGPRLDSEIASLSMRHLLSSCGYAKAEVSMSILQRTWR